MRSTWLAGALCAAVLGAAFSGATASASTGTTQCIAETNGTAIYASEACTRAWMCKQATCWYQPFLTVSASSANPSRRSIAGQARFIGFQPAAVRLPSLTTLTCTATAGSNGLGSCSAVSPPYRRVSNGYRVSVTCWVPSLLVPPPAVGGGLVCGLHWYT